MSALCMGKKPKSQLPNNFKFWYSCPHKSVAPPPPFSDHVIFVVFFFSGREMSTSTVYPPYQSAVTKWHVSYAYQSMTQADVDKIRRHWHEFDTRLPPALESGIFIRRRLRGSGQAELGQNLSGKISGQTLSGHYL